MHACMRTSGDTYTCMNVHIHVHMCRNMFRYLQTRIYIYTPVDTHTYSHRYVFAGTHVHIRRYLHVCMRADICTYVHTYIRTYIHTYIHTHIQNIITCVQICMYIHMHIHTLYGYSPCCTCVAAHPIPVSPGPEGSVREEAFSL